MTKKQQTYYVTSAIVLIAVAFAITLLLPESGNGGDNRIEAEGVSQLEGYPAVTVIVVDDFSGELGELAHQLGSGNNGEAFAEAAVRIRAEVKPAEKGDEAIEIVYGIFQALRERVGGEAAGLLAERLGDVNLEEANCSLNPEGTGFYVAEGTGFYVAEGTGFYVAEGTTIDRRVVSHGARVMAQLRDLNARYGRQVKIEFETVDVAGFRMDIAVDRIVRRIIDVRRAHPDRPIVVNMSFAFLPCVSVSDLMVYERLMLEFDYETAQELAWMREIFRTMLATGILGQKPVGDPTFDSTFCEMYPEAKEVGLCVPSEDRPPIIFVGASGNGAYMSPGAVPVGDPFPYVPAAWGEVIAISGNDDPADFITKPPRAGWSNAGLILMPGRWEWVNKELGIQRWEIGTSFAAPRYSYMLALHLTAAPENVGCGAFIPGPARPNDWFVNPNPSPQDMPPC